MLQIAKRLAALINDDPGMKAIMTRNTDHFVSLGGRVAIARRAKAHLLVSIHADAWIKASARGSSVFCLSERGATSAAARWLAKNQNESDLIGGVNIASVDRQVASVLVDMTSSWTISYSLGLGASVLNEMKSVNRLHKKHVEQAGFAVPQGSGHSVDPRRDGLHLEPDRGKAPHQRQAPAEDRPGHLRWHPQAGGRESVPADGLTGGRVFCVPSPLRQG